MPHPIRPLAILTAVALLLAPAARLHAQRAAVEAPHGLVTSVHELASRAGVEILQKGGNAVAAATGLALAELYDADAADSTTNVVNMSVRTQVGLGENIPIAGFVISGNAPKTVLIRGLGPTLTRYGVTTALVDSQLRLFRSGTLIVSNDDWGGTSVLKSAFTTVGAVDLLSDASKDSALLVTLDPGIYTAQVSGVNSTTGIGLVEIYAVP